MKPLPGYSSEILYSIRSIRKFFSTTLSSHIVPVIFAVGLLFIAESNMSGNNKANIKTTSQALATAGQQVNSGSEDLVSAKAVTRLSTTPGIVAYAGVANITQVVAVCRVTGLLMQIIR